MSDSAWTRDERILCDLSDEDKEKIVSRAYSFAANNRYRVVDRSADVKRGLISIDADELLAKSAERPIFLTLFSENEIYRISITDISLGDDLMITFRALRSLKSTERVFFDELESMGFELRKNCNEQSNSNS